MAPQRLYRWFDSTDPPLLAAKLIVTGLKIIRLCSLGNAPLLPAKSSRTEERGTFEVTNSFLICWCSLEGLLYSPGAVVGTAAWRPPFLRHGNLRPIFAAILGIPCFILCTYERHASRKRLGNHWKLKQIKWLGSSSARLDRHVRRKVYGSIVAGSKPARKAG
jgi:hypothetical protein